MGSISEQLISGLTNHGYSDYDDYLQKGTEIVSNVPLQAFLYFNAITFPFWLIVTLAMIPLKYSELGSLYKFVTILVLITIIVVECVRLYMGYVGNLKEQIPELAGFWLLTILLQTPLQIFLLVCPGCHSSVLEIIMQFIMVGFLVCQLVFGFVALRRSARHSVHAFHLSSFQTAMVDK